MKNKIDIVDLADSQILRFIDELNGVNTDRKAKMLKAEIKRVKNMPVSENNKSRIQNL
jgi:hypothetical protein